MNIHHYLWAHGNTLTAFWIFDKITMTLLSDTSEYEDGLIFADYEEGDYDSERVFHNSPHLLIAESLDTEYKAYHTNMSGYVYAGSNTYDDGNYCLGESISPYDMFPVELLCNYEANGDLRWRGEGLNFERQDNKNSITSWPTIGLQRQVPPEIRDYFTR